MAKGTTGKVLAGAVAGIALGVAASMFLSSKKGKELKGQAGEKVADFYKYIAPKLKNIGKMGEKEYKQFMKDAVEQYSKAKKLSAETAKDLMADMQKSWSHFSKHLTSGK